MTLRDSGEGRNRERQLTRRRFVGLGLAGAALLGAGRLGGTGVAVPGAARLRARPGKPSRQAETGLHDLGLAQGRDGALSIPAGYRPEKPLPLLLMLHGARGRTSGYALFCKAAAELGIAVVTPDSRGSTWDFDLRGYGPDLAFLDRCLEHVFARVAVDPRRLALAGFSDGASYALSAGLANGDLFTHLLAFSPGFMEPPSRQGRPSIWLSHGTRDDVLPIAGSRERIVPQLTRWGYTVRYREFTGGHEVPPKLGSEAFRWFLS